MTERNKDNEKIERNKKGKWVKIKKRMVFANKNLFLYTFHNSQ